IREDRAPVAEAAARRALAPNRDPPAAGAARSAFPACAERAPLALGDLRLDRTLERRLLAVPAPADPLVVEVPDLPGELVRQLVDRVLHVARGLAGSQRPALEMDGRLGDLRVGDRRVPLDRELDLDLGQLVDAAVELLELPLDVAPHGVAHLEVLALDVKLHRRLPCRSCAVRSNPTREPSPWPFLAATKRASERDRLHTTRARGAEGTRDGRGGGARRVDVVDHGDRARRRASRAEGAAHRPPLGGRAAALAAAARPLEKRQARELPESGQLEREPLRRV